MGVDRFAIDSLPFFEESNYLLSLASVFSSVK